MTKTCSNCKDTKPLEEFPPSKGVPNGHSRCRPCKQEYDRNYHKVRPKVNKARKQELQTARVHELRKFIWNYKLTHPCIDCGNTNPIVLEFDHIDGTSKENNVCTMVGNGYKLERIVAEIEKCVVRCANCHRIKTYSQFGWYAFNGGEEES